MTNVNSEFVPILITMVAVSALPFAVMCVTSFVKIQVVLSILRNALGGGQLPSAGITTVVAIVLTCSIMAPVVQESAEKFLLKYREVEAPPSVKVKSQNSIALNDIDQFINAASESVLPIRMFLERQSALRERRYFAALSLDKTSETIADKTPVENLSSLIPAFLVSQLREAFQIGFLLFLPFLIVDLVISNILVGLGMNMVSPVSVALPFKLLLFVMCDGWFLLSKGLIASYGIGAA